MEFKEELSLLLIDKALLALIAGAAWHFYSRWQKRVDREQERADRLEQEARDLKKASAIQNLDREIQFLEASLEQFYWPLFLCMRKDDAIWHRVPALYDDGSQLPTETGAIVESQCLLPNHDRAVSIIESHFHLVATEEDLIEPLLQYIRHVTVFKALRTAGSDLNPIDVNEPFPDCFVTRLQDKLTHCRAALRALREERDQLATADP